MTKIVLSALMTLVITSQLLAQVNLSGRIGYGYYSMSELKEYRDYRLSSLGEIPAKIVSDFPAYLNYRIFISFPRKQTEARVRFYYGFETTGSRISLTDYSGKLIMDLIVAGHIVGFEAKAFSTTIFNVVNLSGNIGFGAVTSVLEMNDYIQVGEEKVTQSYTFYAQGINVEAGLRAAYRYKKLSIGLSLGYLQDMSKDFHLEGNPKVFLGINNFNYIRPNWAGIRTGIEFSVDLFGKSKKKGKK